MSLATVRELGDDRRMVDLGFRDTEGLVASYVFPLEEGVAIVETGPTTCLDALTHGLQRAGVSADEVRQIFVTHIHLDHSGGLGGAARRFPNAMLYAHARGADHLIDPSRLIASARRAWGAAADPLWGPIEPVPADRLVRLQGGERFPVRSGALVAVATPGHASHHLSFLDERTRSVLTGDSLGVKLEGSPWPRPAVPPPDLDLEALLESLDRMEALNPQRILYSHFGPSSDPRGDFEEYRREVRIWRDAALEAARVDPSVPHVAGALRHAEAARLAQAAGGAPTSDLGEQVSGYEMAAQGLLRYFRTRGLLPE